MFIDPVPRGSAEGLTADIYREEMETSGFIPEFVQIFSHHPEAYQAWEQLITTVYSGMDRRACELATFVAARAMKSTACTIAHGRTLRNRFSFTPDEIRQLAMDYHQVGLTAAEEAIVGFAEKVATDPTAVAQADVDALRQLGMTDREIFDVVFAVAARAFLTTLIESLGTTAEQPWVDDLEPELVEALTVGRPAR
jgi:uncharacterized peroxidase-related enzyme